MCQYTRVERRLEQRSRRQPSSTRISADGLRLRLLFSLLVLVGSLPLAARADVQSVGNVIPARNPFDPLNFPGLPTLGNFINPGAGPGSTAQDQTTFEGESDIIVGQTAYGAVFISSNTSLRYQDLIIGDSGEVNGVERVGTGVVRISGIGALYNNDPTILPFGLDYAQFGSRRDATVGFDLYVGRTGTATMELSGGGRAEIQDAVLIGDQPGSVGTLVVTGIDSFLGSGGFSGGGPDEIHSMAIGRQGVGFLSIDAGATVVSEAFAGTTGPTDVPFGAAIGAGPFEQNNPPGEGNSDPGGEGTVTVTGIASKWVVGGSLQIGGFHNVSADGAIDFEAEDAQYSTLAGVGRLQVYDGGFVSVRPAIVADDQTDLLLAIGRFGRIELNGGSVSVGNPGLRDEQVQLINDGVITGSGRIDTGMFHNRYFGEVAVNAGQKLVIAASSEFLTGADPFFEDPLVNLGSIQVVGTVDARAELEFERSPGTVTPLRPTRPLFNLLLTTQPDPATSRGGLIAAEHATLRFGSGLQNQSRLAFTAGINHVHGDVMNIGAPGIAGPEEEEDEDFGDFTEILATGPDTRVTFHDQLGTGGNADINLQKGAKIVALQDFAAAGGEISIELSKTNPSSITVLGDVGLDFVEFNLKLANDVFPLEHGDTFELINFGGALGGVDDTDPFRPVPDLTLPPTISEVSVSPDLFVISPTLVPFINFAEEGIYAMFLDPAMVGGVGAMGPDFNGDGMVDLDDLAIWEMFEGCESGCSVLQGDADGDGDVDGDDLAFWLRNVGTPPPWSGAGAGSGNSLAGNVPEPTSLALLACSGLLALAACRQRRLRH